MRDELIKDLYREILGPRRGSYEEMGMEENPYKEYLTGKIIPKSFRTRERSPDIEPINVNSGISAESIDDLSDQEFDGVSPLENELYELNPAANPKSFGISFQAEGNWEGPVKICVTWGRYRKETRGDSYVWKRHPEHIIKEIRLKEPKKKYGPENNDGNKELGGVILYARRIPNEGSKKERSTVIITVVNELRVADERITEPIEETLFQPSIRVKFPEGLHFPSINPGEYFSDELEFLYRQKPVYSRGFMCSSVWKDVDFGKFDIGTFWPDKMCSEECREFDLPDVRSEFIPLYLILSPDFQWRAEYSTATPELSTDKLSEMWTREQIEDYIRPLIDGYRKWIIKNEEDLKLWKVEQNTSRIVDKVIEKERRLLIRMEKGINILKSNEYARLAFCFANKAINEQQRWGERIEGNRIFKWYPYQLAFIVSSLESIVDTESDDRDDVDLLWVPTGGGKTETYFALMLIAMAHRRLRTLRDKDYAGRYGGTSVITRYTLRLLTVQQFLRTLRIVTAAEYLRVFPTTNGERGWRPSGCGIKGDLIYGALKFSIGLWVGSGITPNKLDEAIKYIDKRGKEKEQESESNPVIVEKCPVCSEWLAIPDVGLKNGEVIYLTVKRKDPSDDVPITLSNYPAFESEIITPVGRQGSPLTLKLKIRDGSKMDLIGLKTEIEKLISSSGLENLSLNVTLPGYFKRNQNRREQTRKIKDFDIYCPNPNCSLNNGINYVEGVPLTLSVASGRNVERLPDGYFPEDPEVMMSGNSRIPIPAYTVDEQIYLHCPSVIVSTVDKFVSMAYNPDSAAIIGNVNTYNVHSGFERKVFNIEDTGKGKRIPKDEIKINPFDPPELIIQDELHLIEGPLGSFFGLFETVFEMLIREARGKPKYITSSATVKDAVRQINLLFARDIFLFPPPGPTIDDSFFVHYPDLSLSREDGWDEKRPGRIYMGYFNQGTSQLTPLSRIISRVLCSTEANKSSGDSKYFKTIVAYFNALRELGGGASIYKEDVRERLDILKNGKFGPCPKKNFDGSKFIELSSRMGSSRLSRTLQNLEDDRLNGFDGMYDALFTTSMFGTGVNISHLSLMIVDGQPKTTSQYIQATGRVGRKHGALVLALLRAGRPRDKSHYEFFLNYHRRTNIEVEDATVSPFSDGTLRLASGPAIVSYLRNCRNGDNRWMENEGGSLIANKVSWNDFDEIRSFIKLLNERLSKTTDNQERIEKIIDYFRSQLDDWFTKAKELRGENMYFSTNDQYNQYSQKNKMSKNVVLASPRETSEAKKGNIKVVFENAPRSMREIEEMIRLKTGYGGGV
jgi:hypothetical protein